MPRYQRDADQRDAFDAITLSVIVDEGHMYTDRIRERVVKRLLDTREPWAVALARSATFPRTLRSSMARLRDTGRIHCEKHGPDTRWSPAGEQRRAV